MRRGIALVAGGALAAATAMAVGALRTTTPASPVTLPPVLVGAPKGSEEAPGIQATQGSRALVGERIPVTLTAYCLPGTTAEGREVGPDVVAADPRVFPLGRSVDVFVGGKLRGRFRVSDTGELVKGRVIDIWMRDCDEARAFGRRRGSAVLLPASESSS